MLQLAAAQAQCESPIVKRPRGSHTPDWLACLRPMCAAGIAHTKRSQSWPSGFHCNCCREGTQVDAASTAAAALPPLPPLLLYWPRFAHPIGLTCNQRLRAKLVRVRNIINHQHHHYDHTNCDLTWPTECSFCSYRASQTDISCSALSSFPLLCLSYKARQRKSLAEIATYKLRSEKTL